MTTKPAPASSAPSNRAVLLRYAGPALWAMAFLGCAVITVFFWFGERCGNSRFLIVGNCSASISPEFRPPIETALAENCGSSPLGTIVLESRRSEKMYNKVLLLKNILTLTIQHFPKKRFGWTSPQRRRQSEARPLSALDRDRREPVFYRWLK